MNILVSTTIKKTRTCSPLVINVACTMELTIQDQYGIDCREEGLS